jgi:hypothetical protein
MSRKKRMQSVREAKDRRAKKLAIGGGVLLAILLAWELPHYLGGHKSATPPPATTTATSTTPGTTAPATTPATTTPGVTPVTATGTPASSSKLPNSDTPPRYAKGQLAGFSTFASKDPFVQQIAAQAAPCTCSGSGSGSVPAGSGPAPSSGSPVVTSARTLAHGGALTIAINGKRESVRVGGSFPSANPIFRLVSVTGGAARIGIANGSLSSGAQTVLLRLDRTLTLVDTANNVHYKLRLLG